MKRIELEQGSEEWLAWRRKRGMASESSAIMGLNPYQTAEQIRSIKRGTNKQYTNAAMERGHREEAVAREVYERDSADMFQPACFEMGEFGASVDGINMDGTQLLEIKSPADGRDSARWDVTADGGITDYDYIQVQHQLMVTGAQCCYFMVWSGEPESDQPYVGIMIEPNARIWERIVDAWKEFWPTVAERDDDEWAQAAAAYKEAKAAHEEAAKALDEAKLHLITLSGKYSYGAGVRVKEVTRTGQIDWKKIREDKLPDADIERYRKPGSSFFQVEIVEES